MPDRFVEEARRLHAEAIKNLAAARGLVAAYDKEARRAAVILESLGAPIVATGDLSFQVVESPPEFSDPLAESIEVRRLESL